MIILMTWTVLIVKDTIISISENVIHQMSQSQSVEFNLPIAETMDQNYKYGWKITNGIYETCRYFSK